MKKNITILILLISLAHQTQARKYYISATGSDSNSGLTTLLPKQTLTAVNSLSLVKGDSILFKKGDGWYGSLITSCDSIIYTAYGTGTNPIITGFTTITGWTDEGGGIYSNVITSDAQTNMVTFDGVITAMGRYPNSSYLIYESASTNVSITDNELTGTPSWKGAEVVIRKNDWALERRPITNHTTNTITYSGAGWNGISGCGYFIQNDLRTLDQLGEWYHNTANGKFYMYFGAVDPTTKAVNVATKNYCIDIQGRTYITIVGLTINGSINNCVYTSSVSNNLTVKNCTISFSGSNGIYINSTNALIDNNSISGCNASAIRGTSSNITVTNNTITNNGLIKGASNDYYNAVMLSGTNNHIVQYNSIVNSGSSGIAINAGMGINVSNNFVNYSGMILNDNGGIYTSYPNSGTTISGNVVLNSVGNYDGGSTLLSLSEGIYLDELSSGVTVQNNSIAYCGYSGIKLHMANTNIIQNNTCFGNTQTGIYLLNSSTTASTVFNNTISGNIIVALNYSNNITLKDTYNSTCVFGTATNNLYAKPTAANFSTNVVGSGWVDKTLAQWKTFSGQDLDAKIAPFVFVTADARLEYNATNTPVVVALDQNYRDIQTNADHTSYTLAAFSSVVLMKHAAYPSTATRKNVTYNKKTVVYHGKALRY